MDALSDDDHDFDDVLPGPSREYPEEEMSVDDAICTLLASLHLDQNRNVMPSEQDDDNLRIVHERIQNVILREIDDSRRRRLRKALQPSNCIREQVYYLRRIIPNTNPSQSYFRRLSAALSLIVSESFDEEYRKVAILLGLVDALAETLVLEVFVFGTSPRLHEHRSIRKLIANALTNLTFGHVASKRRLCAYPDFLSTVIRLINEARVLAQVYAGLIRNLSWLADNEMISALSPCVRALVRAAIYGCQNKNEGCVKATLSALWNLASHSMENKRVICDEPGCLQMLASLLTPNTYQTVIVESASGILKYASAYLSTTSTHLEERTLLVNGLIQLLVSASFTISCNALGALGNLISKDPHLQAFIRSNGNAMHQLNSLRDSARDDIRTAVKSVLNHLNQPSGYIRTNEMSASMGVGYDHFRDSGRLLPLRSMRASPGANNVHSFTSPRSMEQRSSSLPRHFVRGGSVAMHGSSHASPSHFIPPPVNQATDEQERMLQQINEDEIRHNSIINDDDNGDFIEDFERDTMSATCNRSNASRQSLETEHTNQSGWASMLDTANNSARLSPVSPSELPDSPTHYTLVRQQEIMNASRQGNNMSTPLRVNVLGSDSNEKSNFSSSDAATAVIEDQATPTFPLFRGQVPPPPIPSQSEDVNHLVFPGSSSEIEMESDYAVLEGNSDLLDRSIEAAYPQPLALPNFKVAPNNHQNSFMLNTVISNVSTPRKSAVSTAADRERLLNECILSAMPIADNNTLISSKNEMGGPISMVTHSARPSQAGRRPDSEFVDENFRASCSQDDESKKMLAHQDSISSDGSDEFFGRNDFDELDTSLPLDCLEEHMTIDCSSLRSVSTMDSNKNRATDCGSSTRKTRLPMPTSKVLQSSNCRPSQLPSIAKPKIAPKPLHSHAVIPPYNYQKPMHDNEEPSTESAKSGSVHSNTMLVTTV